MIRARSSRSPTECAASGNASKRAERQRDTHDELVVVLLGGCSVLPCWRVLGAKEDELRFEVEEIRDLNAENGSASMVRVADRREDYVRAPVELELHVPGNVEIPVAVNGNKAIVLRILFTDFRTEISRELVPEPGFEVPVGVLRIKDVNPT